MRNVPIFIFFSIFCIFLLCGWFLGNSRVKQIHTV